MIGTWMLYSVAVGLLLTAAALLLERTVQALGGATRRVWALALAAGVALPVLALVGLRARAGAAARPGADGAADAVARVILATSDGAAFLQRFDLVLLLAWGAVSAAVLGRLAWSAFRIERDRRRWEPARLAGVPVYLSRDVGPAVVGFLRPRIVFPRWALAVDRSLRHLMVRHEEEHLRGRDPQLLLLAGFLLLAMPWNPALWLMVRRLRLAVEVDCDRRVLERLGCDVGTYGHLLIEVGSRRSRTAFPAAAFSRPRSLLEHRIDRMTLPSPHGWLRGGAASLAALALVVAALSIPDPVSAVGARIQLPVCQSAHTTSTGSFPLVGGPGAPRLPSL